MKYTASGNLLAVSQNNGRTRFPDFKSRFQVNILAGIVVLYHVDQHVESIHSGLFSALCQLGNGRRDDSVGVAAVESDYRLYNFSKTL